MNKIDAAKEFIKSADSIYEDFLLNFDYSNLELLDDDEKKRKTNQYATLYAQICEYFLKALLLPNLQNENFDVNSEREMEYLANDRNGLRKFNHIFKRIINDENFDRKIRENIINFLAKKAQFVSDERNNYLDEMLKKAIENDDIGLIIALTDPMKRYEVYFSTENPSYNTKIDAVIDKIIGEENGEILKNSDIYPKSRYAMIDNDYIANLPFLIDLTNALKDSLKKKFNNCLDVKGCSRHIFPDLDSGINIIYASGNTEIFYLDDKANLWITRPNGDKEDSIAYIWNYNRQTNSRERIEEISYSESGIIKILKYDKIRNSYKFIKSREIEKSKKDTSIIR